MSTEVQKQIKDGLTPMEDDFHAQWKAEDTRKERERIEAERLAKQEAEQERMAKLGDAERFAAVADALRQARSAIAQIAQGVQSKEGRMWMEEMQARVAQEIRRVENGALALSKARQVEPA